jgi:hypothetical protein
MPTSQGGEVKEQDFSKAPAGTSFMTAEDLKDFAGEQQGTMDKAAAALGGKVTKPVAQSEALEGVGVVNKVVDLDSQPEEEEDEELVEIDVADRREFLRTLMAGEPFEKETQLFGGRLVVRFSTRTVQENREINAEVENLDGVEYLRMRQRARLIKSMKFLKLKTGQELVPAEDVAAVLDAQSDIVYSALLAAFREFEKICDVMFRKANDPDFWTETGGAS